MVSAVSEQYTRCVKTGILLQAEMGITANKTQMV
jgi:hypothetical protein